jgi:hypothetical protein
MKVLAQCSQRWSSCGHDNKLTSSCKITDSTPIEPSNTRALEAGFQTHMAKAAEPAELVVVVGSLIENGLRPDQNTG